MAVAALCGLLSPRSGRVRLSTKLPHQALYTNYGTYRLGLSHLEPLVSLYLTSLVRRLRSTTLRISDEGSFRITRNPGRSNK